MRRKITNKIKSSKPNSFHSTLQIPDSELKSLAFRWVDDCRLNGLSHDTLKEYSDKAERFLWWWFVLNQYDKTLGSSPKNVTTKEAKEFAGYLREPLKERWGLKTNKQVLSPATISSYGRSLKAFFGWLQREEYITHSPFHNKSVKFTNQTKADRVIKTVSQENLTKIFQYLSSPKRAKTFTGVRDLAIITILLDSGMRRGELLSLTIEHLDMKKMRCIISGKTGQRFAFFSIKCKGVLSDYLKLRLEVSEKGPLWMTLDGEPLNNNSFGSLMRRIKAGCGVSFHAHELRHTFATMMSSKVTAFELMDMLGHSSVATTQIYVQQNPDRIGAAYRPNSPLTTLDEIRGLRRPGRPPKLNK